MALVGRARNSYEIPSGVKGPTDGPASSAVPISLSISTLIVPASRPSVSSAISSYLTHSTKMGASGRSNLPAVLLCPSTPLNSSSEVQATPSSFPRPALPSFSSSDSNVSSVGSNNGHTAYTMVNSSSGYMGTC